MSETTIISAPEGRSRTGATAFLITKANKLKRKGKNVRFVTHHRTFAELRQRGLMWSIQIVSGKQEHIELEPA